MAKTRHIHQRMSQRGITSSMLDLVKQFGVQNNGDATILNKKSVKNVLYTMNKLIKEMKKIESKGGIVLIEKDGVEITTYNLNSYNKN